MEMGVKSSTKLSQWLAKPENHQNWKTTRFLGKPLAAIITKTKPTVDSFPITTQTHPPTFFLLFFHFLTSQTTDQPCVWAVMDAEFFAKAAVKPAPSDPAFNGSKAPNPKPTPPSSSPNSTAEPASLTSSMPAPTISAQVLHPFLLCFDYSVLIALYRLLTVLFVLWLFQLFLNLCYSRPVAGLWTRFSGRPDCCGPGAGSCVRTPSKPFWKARRFCRFHPRWRRRTWAPPWRAATSVTCPNSKAPLPVQHSGRSRRGGGSNARLRRRTSPSRRRSRWRWPSSYSMTRPGLCRSPGVWSSSWIIGWAMSRRRRTAAATTPSACRWRPWRLLRWARVVTWNWNLPWGLDTVSCWRD